MAMGWHRLPPTFSMVLFRMLMLSIHQPAPNCLSSSQVGSPFCMLGIWDNNSWIMIRAHIIYTQLLTAQYSDSCFGKNDTIEPFFKVKFYSHIYFLFLINTACVFFTTHLCGLGMESPDQVEGLESCSLKHSSLSGL